MSKAKIQALVLFILIAVLIFLVYGKQIAVMAGWPSAVRSGSWLAVKLHFVFGADVNAVKPGFKSRKLFPCSPILTS
jgi:hypothetical protein